MPIPARTAISLSLIHILAEHDMDDASRATLLDIVDTPISPELIPADENGNIQQITEDLVDVYKRQTGTVRNVNSKYFIGI